MRRNENFDQHLFIGILGCLTFFMQGCVSVQLPAKDGKPRIIGFGSVKQVGGKHGQVYEIVAPGLSLRLDSAASGISLGWHETRLFYTVANGATNSTAEPVAIQTKCLGVNLSPWQIMAGYENIFAIPFNGRESSMVQAIIYSENYPANTIVMRKEMK
jgi:hypothetical protein